MNFNTKQSLTILCGATMILVAGCSSTMKVQAISDTASSKEAVSSAESFGADQFAPAELKSAREKLDQANKALEDKKYKLADDLANQAEADAKLAQSKAHSAQAQKEFNTVKDDIRALHEEMSRAANSSAPTTMSPVKTPAPAQ